LGLTNIVTWPYILGAANVTFYAKWTANVYTVSFDAQGGTVSPGTISATYDSTYGTLPVPVKTGHTFGGWYTGTNGIGVMIINTTAVSITGPQTLYAKWTVNSYTVAFDANGGTGSTSSQMAFGSAITAPTVTRTGYTFTAWDPAVPPTVPAADSSYTAQWSINSYTIIFDANGGTGSKAPVTQNYLTSVTLPATGFAKTGYTFIGWNTTANAATALSSYNVPAGDATLYAVYAINHYTVSFDANGGTGSASPVTQDYGTSVTLPTTGFTKTGYTFIGWNTNPNAATALSSYHVPAGDATLYAVYAVNQYTISFDANSGTGSASPVTQDFGTAVTLPSAGFTKTGYTFKGWSTTANGTTPIESYTVPANDATLYAVYAINQYTAADVTQDYGTGIVLPTMGFEKTGYTFIGWGTTPSATTPISIYNIPADNSTLYAIYVINQYTVSFNANGGTGSASPVTQDFGSSVTLPEVGFTKTGYTFLGWNTTPGAVTALPCTGRRRDFVRGLRNQPIYGKL
jgi:uncharacterized repeat protein (TIGR02543 family)